MKTGDEGGFMSQDNVLHFATGINQNALRVREFMQKGRRAQTVVDKVCEAAHDSPAYPRSGRGAPAVGHPEHLNDEVAWDQEDAWPLCREVPRAA